MQVFCYILLPVALIMNFLLVPVHAQAVEPTIRVNILSNVQTVLISGESDFEILSGETGKQLARFTAGEQVSFAVKEKSMTINDKKVDVAKCRIVQFRSTNAHPITVNSKQYRGNIDVIHGKIGLSIVNVLPMEQYLYGVVGKEMSGEWALEAVKAQAVAARTYALYKYNQHQAGDYDVGATTDCQVYGGLDNETPRVLKAVDDTVGQVLIYQGNLIPAYFHSSSGGYTENSENVWGTYQPYSRGVVDYDQHSPHYKWEKKLTASELAEAISRAGYQLGVIKTIELAPLTKAPMSIPERGVSGRVKVMGFVGTTGSAQLTGEKIRTILDLKSTLFDISILSSMPKAGEFQLQNKNTLHRLSGRPDEVILISGFGWGHGLGLSQWGAKAMAEKGPLGDATYYKEILKHYYQGTTIEKVF
jgi:stage II sporulation protein D